MDTMNAWANLQAAKSRGATVMVFDWHKAARLIRERSARGATAGLDGDYENTGGVIFDGAPVHDQYTYLASKWATPILMLDGEEEPCFIEQGEARKLGWDAATKWPQSALDILSGKTP